MQSKDFMYDGQYLSDYGFMIANITTNEQKTVISEGSILTFEKTTRNRGKSYSLLATSYDSAYTTAFDICKNPSFYDDLEISNDEFRDLMRWLNRREFLQFCFIPDNGDETEKYWNASFNIEKINVGKCLIGLHLTMETDSAIGYGQEIAFNYNVSDTDTVFTLSDMSDEIGYIFLDITIEILRDGDLRIYNQTYKEITEIKNCRMGEIIKFNGQSMIISTDSATHKQTLANDFNFVFLRIGNTINNRQNKLKFSLPCKVKIRYRPLIK